MISNAVGESTICRYCLTASLRQEALVTVPRLVIWLMAAGRARGGNPACPLPSSRTCQLYDLRRDMMPSARCRKNSSCYMAVNGQAWSFKNITEAGNSDSRNV